MPAGDNEWLDPDSGTNYSNLVATQRPGDSSAPSSTGISMTVGTDVTYDYGFENPVNTTDQMYLIPYVCFSYGGGPNPLSKVNVDVSLDGGTNWEGEKKLLLANLTGASTPLFWMSAPYGPYTNAEIQSLKVRVKTTLGASTSGTIKAMAALVVVCPASGSSVIVVED